MPVPQEKNVPHCGSAARLFCFDQRSWCRTVCGCCKVADGVSRLTPTADAKCQFNLLNSSVFAALQISLIRGRGIVPYLDHGSAGDRDIKRNVVGFRIITFRYTPRKTLYQRLSLTFDWPSWPSQQVNLAKPVHPDKRSHPSWTSQPTKLANNILPDWKSSCDARRYVHKNVHCLHQHERRRRQKHAGRASRCLAV